ncbi:TetR/AcrR family transcriptional regulator [Kribbella sp. NPDC051587]|uniref:TetR/AcrR family transcriptional regulator n=1 Tax=Kribbella sp. NPDC051587 TaxID=3364119 RepID=UPI0037A3A515
MASAMAVLNEDGFAGLTTRSVASRANASVPAIYEVFGDKAGIIREVFLEGFRLLAAELAELPPSADPIEGLEQLATGFRQFLVRNEMLAGIMFARPFADFDPSKDEVKAGAEVRKIFVQRVKDAVAARQLQGEPTDLALVLFTFVTGMAAAENARRLGGSKQTIDRRWKLGMTALINGFR